MTFKDVIFKNFKGNFKKYFAYFLSGSFSILLFFMYATLILNKNLKGRPDTEALDFIFPITMVAIALFSVFFINYAHSAFIKGRNKEFGVYLSLGMNSKELRKLVNMENIIISSASIFTGIGVGALFSRLFQMLILRLLDINDISYYLDFKPFLLTLLVFVFIYFIVMAVTYLRMGKADIQGLLKEARKSEGKEYTWKDLVLGGLGLVIMVFSVVFLIIIAKDEDLNSNPSIILTYMILAFLGVYLTISSGGNLIIHFIKKSKYYYKNMLSVSEIHHKFNQNRKIIFILSALSTMTIFLVASPFSLFSLTEEIAEMSENHLEYVELGSINKLPEETLEHILNDKEVENTSKVKFIFLSTKKGADLLKDSKLVVSVDEYNRMTGSSLSLTSGEAYQIIIDWIPGDHGIKAGSTHEFYDGTNTYRYKFKDSRKGEWIAGTDSFPTDAVIVIANKDFKTLTKEISKNNIGYYHLVNFKNWKNSQKIIDELKTNLEKSELPVVSILDYYKSLKNNYAVFLFVSTVMGILFFVAGGSVLYFKQFTELPEAKLTFQKLYKIGISDKEMRKVVGKELLVVFFLPLIFGSFLGVSLIYLTTFIVGGDEIIREFIENAFKVVAVYFISQGIFYLITRERYIHEVTRN